MKSTGEFRIIWALLNSVTKSEQIEDCSARKRSCRGIEAYDGLARGELEYEMSASSSPPPSPHRIAILMSRAGRFLECRDCLLSFEFPAGARYEATAQQFDFHLCRRPAPRIVNVVPHRERRFVIVRYEGKVPAMASCTKCQRKFFTSATFARDPSGAEQYLGQKFDVHDCPKDNAR